MNKPVALTFFLLAALGACSDIERTADCHDICDKYMECADSNYNVSACTDRCEDMASKDETKQIDECSDCIESKSCTGSVFNCTAECAGILLTSS